MKTIVAIAVALGVAGQPMSARAGEVGEWYGWQIMAVDAGGAASVVAASKLDGNPEAVVAIAGWTVLAFGGGVVHLLNERDLGVAGASVGARAFGALMAGITLLGGVSGEAPSVEISTGRWVLAWSFFAAGLAVDWFLLANQPEPEGVGQSYGLSFGSAF